MKKKIADNDDNNTNAGKNLTENSHVTFPPASQRCVQDWRQFYNIQVSSVRDGLGYTVSLSLYQ